MDSRILELHGRNGLEAYKALSSEVRVRILALLAEGPMNINALGNVLGMSQPTITRHVQALEQAGLVLGEYMPGSQGTQKLCWARYGRLLLSFESPSAPRERVHEVAMPIGMYMGVAPQPTCGLAGRERVIGFYDDPQSFLLPDRSHAQILWMADGYVEYQFPNTLPTSVEIERVDVVMEICSEAPDYDMDHPSDITVWVNGAEAGTWTSPGDLGDRRGRLNPAWWHDRNTQYGLLTTWSVGAQGTDVNGEPVSGCTLRDIGAAPRQPFTVRIGIKPGARHVGGFNLFGRGFGDHGQDLLLRLHYSGPEEG